MIQDHDLTPTEIEALSKVLGPSVNRSPIKDSPYTSQASTAQFSQLKKEEVPLETTQQFQENLKNLNIQLDVILGRTKISISKLLKIHPGYVIPLDKLAGEPVDIEANGTLVARGEVVVIEKHFGIKITQLIDSEYA